MSLRLSLAAVTACAMLGCATPTLAQSNGADAIGTWESTVNAVEGGVASTLSEDEIAAVQTVSQYFNDMTTLTGRFEQIDPDGKVKRGKVLVAKPGRFRFEYSRPSREVVISDGSLLAIQDRDLKTEETYELTNTPFRMLLRENVDLLSDAQVLQVKVEPTQTSLVLRDKDPDVAAAIKVVVTTAPEMALRGWITRDAQGLETKVILSDVSHGETLNPALFLRERFYNASGSSK